MITNDVPNGTILIIGAFKEHVLIVAGNGGADKWGYSLKYDDCWLLPLDSIPNLCDYNGHVTSEWVLKATAKLELLFNSHFMSNLDYIEAVAKIKEYELF